MLKPPRLTLIRRNSAESVERHFGIQSNNFDSNHFDEVNQFIEGNYEYFYAPEDPNDNRSDMDDDHDLVADIDSDTLIKIVKFLKRGKAPGPDNIHNDVLRLGTATSLFHHLARLFTSSIQIGYIPTAWKLATLRMLLKPEKLPSLTTSYRPISLMSSIMKLFERVIEQRLRSYLEDIGFINKYQSGFRQNKSTDDHLFRLSQSREREHVNLIEKKNQKLIDCNWIRTSVTYLGLFFRLLCTATLCHAASTTNRQNIFDICAGSPTLVQQKNPVLAFSRRRRPYWQKILVKPLLNGIRHAHTKFAPFFFINKTPKQKMKGKHGKPNIPFLKYKLRGRDESRLKNQMFGQRHHLLPLSSPPSKAMFIVLQVLEGSSLNRLKRIP